MSNLHSTAPSQKSNWLVLPPILDGIVELAPKNVDQTTINETDGHREIFEGRSPFPILNDHNFDVEQYDDFIVYTNEPHGGGDELPCNNKRIVDDALLVISELGPNVYPHQAATIKSFTTILITTQTLVAGKDVWRPKAGRKKKEDKEAESPVSFLYRVYNKEILEGKLTEDQLSCINERFPETYRKWVYRHPQDAIWPPRVSYRKRPVLE